EILVGSGVGSRSRNDDGVIDRAGLFENRDRPGDVGHFLTDRDVDTIDGLVILQLALFGGLVLVRLGNDGVDGDGRLAGGTVADDQLALTAADRNHRIDGHDAGLDRNADRLAGNDAGSDFFDRIRLAGIDVAFSVDRLAERVDD